MGGEPHGLAYNQATVVVKLWFDELVRTILPLSAWWKRKVCLKETTGWDQRHGLLIEELQLPEVQERLACALAHPQGKDMDTAHDDWPDLPPDLLWTIRVVGTIALANGTSERQRKSVWPPPSIEGRQESKRVAYFRRVVQALASLMQGVATDNAAPPLVYVVSRNRPAMVSIWRSSTAVKADAAKTLFNVKCDGLAWAIIDSGIDARHPAFFCRTAGNPRPMRTARGRSARGCWPRMTSPSSGAFSAPIRS